MKRKIIYQEKYNKGTIVDNIIVKKLIENNIDNILIELISRAKCNDDTEEMVIKIKNIKSE